ncbi:hypothetical protein M4I32_05640 [Microbacterium sp. LRZ72]|uniref:hypothetical protein n=1 Tax=Microbacterium sp. LRZ72 TaxID=2942481 RepID=UPI0029A86C57|nr:hypothetical protein [Microbacterium sp. LRZ72]MDX2376279.1 hypothetical protein [Microbacterium sp. LRZ72]
MNRTVGVVRMQLVNRQTYIWIPLIVLAGAFVLTLLIWSLVPHEAVKYGGGAQAPLWYFGVVGVQALTLTFPFSQAMSVTRREFFLGTLLTAALTAAILAAIFVCGGLIEQLTNGWGMNGYFFYLDWIWQSGPLVAGLFFFVIAMLFFVVGFWSATVYKRFGGVWLTSILVGIGLVLVGLLWLIGRLQAWPSVIGWIGAQGALGLGVWGLALVAVLAASAFVTLRRAVP